MAESVRDWTQWHLTPRGWEMGSWEVSGDSGAVPPPADRVLSCEYREAHLPSAKKTEGVSRQLWRGDDAKQIVHLLAKWGPAPRTLNRRRRSR